MTVADEKSTETRDVIMAVAAKLFARRGYQATSVREICEAAGVTKPVVYYYFKSKSGLIEALLNGAFNAFDDAVAKAEAEQTIGAQLHAIVDAQLNFARAHPHVVELMARLDVEPLDQIPDIDLDRRREGHISRIAQIFLSAMERGEIDRRPVEFLVVHFLGTFVMHLMTIVREHPGLQTTATANEIVDACLFGVTTFRNPLHLLVPQ